ncbi:MAG: sigma-54 dependent transcriptional regulator [Kiritimatiellia bacterium]|nr:sigma-54 dependent transcriptional regulator [Kiritimatiellia bacterium]
MARILVVDDEPSILNVLTTLLRKQKHETTPANSGAAALELIEKESFDLVLSDIKMEPIDGLQLLNAIRKRAPSTVVILLTGYGSIKTAVDAMRGGAFDYITKPFKVDELMVTVERALDYHNLMTENIGLKAQLAARYRLSNIVAESPGMRRVCDMVERVAPTDATALLIGESGTGKELVARAIHANSTRREKPFIPINCAAMPEALLESEMFGHVKGAFTGAVTAKEGLFEAASGGTLFLDEIGAMPLGIQAKFLRVLQDKQIRKVGGTEMSGVDVRIIAATNEPLEKKIERDEFREDLFYRISVIPIEIPPLRERPEDILPLITSFIERERSTGKEAPSMDLNVQQVLEAYSWPGNVRELENAIRHALTFAKAGRITQEDLPPRILESVGSLPPPRTRKSQAEEFRGNSLKAFLRAKEREYVTSVIESLDGDKEKAAKALNVSLATLYRKLPE